MGLFFFYTKSKFLPNVRITELMLECTLRHAVESELCISECLVDAVGVLPSIGTKTCKGGSIIRLQMKRRPRVV